ncbi:MAG: nucleotidyltransferase family protein [Litorimonas sp.]
MSTKAQTPKKCALILLASGLSKRFGADDKLLASLAGKPVIDHTLDHIAPAGFELHIAVIGTPPKADTGMRDKLARAGYHIIVNPAPEDGQGSSLALGAQAAIDAGYHQACIALADMPLVPTAHFTKLLNMSVQSEQVVSEAHIDERSVTLPPCVFSGQALQRLTTASGDSGAKKFLCGTDIVRCKLLDWAAQDIDTPEDLQSLKLFYAKTFKVNDY